MRRKALVFFLTILFTFPSIKAQKEDKNSIGIYSGVSYYQGDFNYKGIFQANAPLVGIVYRIHSNKRNVWRISFSYTNLKLTNNNTNLHGVYTVENTFSRQNMIEYAFQSEFNFLPFNEKTLGKEDFTPYISTGLFSAVLISTGPKINYAFGIPLALGVKYAIRRRFTIGLEYGYRFNFTDSLDGVVDKFEKKAVFHNKDLYAFAGLFITWRIYNRGFICPAYK